MRLWHKDLIHALPRQQLISQWRECCCIAKNLANNNTPNHRLVNKILDYPIDDFLQYTNLVIEELKRRGYRISQKALYSFINNIKIYTENNIKHFPSGYARAKDYSIFQNWHDHRYFTQNFYNLQEKYDCGIITNEEWMSIYNNLYIKNKGEIKNE